MEITSGGTGTQGPVAIFHFEFNVSTSGLEIEETEMRGIHVDKITYAIVMTSYISKRSV